MLDPINVKFFKFAVGSGIGKETPNDISAKCVICGDSEKDERQKRLHLYRKTQYENDVVHCFNCEFSGNMYSFLREYDTTLFEQYKREKRETSFNNLKEKKQDTEAVVMQNTYKKKSKIFTFPFPKEFIPSEENEKAKKYLSGRKLTCDDIYYSPDGIKLGEKYIPIKDCIVIPLWHNKELGTVYGFQARSIEGKTFYTYIPDENTGYKVWNWFGIDKTKPIFVFESVFDAKSSGLPEDRIVAALGADLNEDRINEVNEAIFCFDNQFKDPTSKKKSTDLLQNGFRVFVWPTNIEEKDSNKWLQNSTNGESFARIILTNIESGGKGVLRLKLGK